MAQKCTYCSEECIGEVAARKSRFGGILDPRLCDEHNISHIVHCDVEVEDVDKAEEDEELAAMREQRYLAALEARGEETVPSCLPFTLWR